MIRLRGLTLNATLKGMAVYSCGSEIKLTVLGRRLARRCSYWNGTLWAIGNGLTSSTLVVYLALELGGPGLGLGIGLILAAPRLVGVLRLLVPLWIAQIGNRKRFTLGSYGVSAGVLAVLPVAAAPNLWNSPIPALGMLVLGWCLYHLLEFFGTVALYAWLADLVSQPGRGRFLGQRQRWMLIGQLVAMLAAGLISHLWQRSYPDSPRWTSYAIPAVLGAGFMLAALGPLAVMPEIQRRGSGVPVVRVNDLLAPLGDLRFLRFLAFGCWFSFFNGLTQSVQTSYPGRVLKVDLFPMLSMQTTMRVGQMSLSPTLGRVADEWGNKNLIAACLPIVASGLLFYFLATLQAPWWITGAWLLWIAYAGINIAQPNLILKLADPPSATAAYVAVFQGITDWCVAISTLVGGWLYDRLVEQTFWLGNYRLDFYQMAFLFGTVTRLLGLGILAWVREPPQKPSAPS